MPQAEAVSGQSSTPEVKRDKVHLFVATPAMNHLVDARFVKSLIRLQALCKELDWGYTWWEAADSLIPRARHRYIQDFMRGPTGQALEQFGPYTHLLSIDSDIVFDARCVPMMVTTEHAMVCCAYPKKTINFDRVGHAARLHEPHLNRWGAEFAINTGAKEGTSVTTENYCIPILDAATGFLLTTRAALVDMHYAYPELLYVDDDKGSMRGAPGVGLFDCYTETEELRPLSEDYAFSRRWQKMGGTVWLYLGPACHLGHVGGFEFQGNIFNAFLPQLAGGHIAQESALPEESDMPGYGAIMLERYEWAAEQLKDARRIADACAGPGYGMPILARHGAEVVGFDRDPENLRKCREHGFGEMVQAEDIQQFRLDGFDALCSLETFEHLPDPITWLRNLSPSVTRVVLSCPCIPTKHRNPHHLADYTYQEVLNIVKALGWVVKADRHQDSGAVVMVYAERGLLALDMQEAAQ